MMPRSICWKAAGLLTTLVSGQPAGAGVKNHLNVHPAPPLPTVPCTAANPCGVADGIGVMLGVFDGVKVAVGGGVFVRVGVAVRVAVRVGVRVGVSVTVAVAVLGGVGVSRKKPTRVSLGVAVGVCADDDCSVVVAVNRRSGVTVGGGRVSSPTRRGPDSVGVAPDDESQAAIIRQTNIRANSRFITSES
jgi:hypothetical protein